MDEIKVIDVKMYEVWIRRRILGRFKTKGLIKWHLYTKVTKEQKHCLLKCLKH